MISAAPVTSVRVDARVLLAGAFGQGNPGDEALLSAFAHALPGADLVATSSAPEETEARHGLPALARHDPLALGRALRAADAVVFAGGTIFKRLHPSSGRPPLALLARGAALAGAVKAQRKLLAIVGAGAGSLDGRVAPRLARSMVRAADLLVLRDDESADRLAAAGAPAPMRVGADPAWTLPLARERPILSIAAEGAATSSPAVGEPSTSSPAAESAATSSPTLGEPSTSSPVDGAATSSPALGEPSTSSPADGAATLSPALGEPSISSPAAGAVLVALSHLAGGRDLCERLGAALTPLRDAGVPVALQPWQEDGDTGLAAALSSRLGAAVLEPPADLAAAAAGFAGARLVFGLRFHSLVAAAAAGVPFLAFAHEPKLAAAARRLGQPAVDPTAPPRAVTTALLAALDGPAAAPAAVRRERERAEDGFRLLRVLLARGRTEEAPAVHGLALRPEEWL
jgi:polysaccharide pyruvyl transferase WcaK-like protein